MFTRMVIWTCVQLYMCTTSLQNKRKKCRLFICIGEYCCHQLHVVKQLVFWPRHIWSSDLHCYFQLACFFMGYISFSSSAIYERYIDHDSSRVVLNQLGALRRRQASLARLLSYNGQSSLPMCTWRFTYSCVQFAYNCKSYAVEVKIKIYVT